MSDQPEYTVGKNKPPVETRFQSGNAAAKTAKGVSKATVPPLLSAMRGVSKGIGDPAKYVGLRKHCHKMLEENPTQFLKQLASLEELYTKSKQPSASGEGAGAVDEKDQDLKALIESLIGGFRGKHA